MASKTTSSVLLARARDLGDQDAWFRIDEQYGEVVIRQAEREGLSRADAEDLRQHVLCRLMVVLPRFRYGAKSGRFRSYLRVLVRRVAHRWRRKQTLAQGEPLCEERWVDPRSEDSADPWDGEWMREHLQQAIVTIAPRVRPRSLAILRRYLAGERTEQIAAALDMGIDAVRKARQRIRARLATQVHCQLRAEDSPPGSTAGSTAESTAEYEV